MKELSIEEIHKETMKILCFIDSICKKLDIQYFALYGTALGAVRHHGFIPWDDDLDIGMFRKDYDIFCNYLQNDRDEKYYLDNIKTNSCYPYYISRVCDKEHIVQFESYNYKSGLFIDIYPFDGMGNEKDKDYWEMNLRRLLRLQNGLILSSRKPFYIGRPIFKGIVKSFLYLPAIILSKLLGGSYYYNRLDHYKDVFELEESEYVGIPCWTTPRIIRYPKSDFKTLIQMKYEDASIPVPVGYDNILRDIYGDYMTPPPPERQKPHHDYSAKRR